MDARWEFRAGIRAGVIAIAIAAALQLWAPAACGQERIFRRGDANNDGRISLADPVRLMRWLGLADSLPGCLAGDVDGNGEVQLSDAMHFLEFLFLGEKSIPPPFDACSPGIPGDHGGECRIEPRCGDPIPPAAGRFHLFASSRSGAEEPDAAETMIRAIAGREIDVPFTVFLKGGTEEGFGPEAWAFGLALETEAIEARIESVTREGTVIGPGGLLSAGFALAERAGTSAAASAAILSILEVRAMITGPSHPVLRGTIRARAPAAGASGSLTLVPASGIQGSGEPVILEVYAGEPYLPDASPLRVRIEGLDPALVFLRSDANQDGEHDISDAVFTLESLFLGGAPPVCPDAADANDDGALDISDAVFSLECLFLGNACPQAPYPGCGPDPTADALSCAARPGACD